MGAPSSIQLGSPRLRYPQVEQSGRPCPRPRRPIFVHGYLVRGGSP